MKTFITSKTEWIQEYRKNKHNVWIIVELENGKELYLRDYAEWLDLVGWLSMIPEKRISNVKLQYRSNVVEIDTSSSKGVYLVRSLIGEMGGKTRNTYTVGLVNNGKMQKTIWLTPELIVQESYEDEIDNCFFEALILWN